MAHRVLTIVLASRNRLVVLLLALSAVIGCEARRPPRQAGTEILFATLHAADPAWPALEGGARRHVQAVPSFPITVLAATSEDADQFVPRLEQRLRQSPPPRGLCLHVPEAGDVDPNTVELVLAAGARASLVIVTLGRRLPDDERVYAHAGAYGPDAAELLGRRLPEIAGGRRSYLVAYDETAREGAAVHNRFRATAEYAPLHLLAARGASAETPASAVVETLLTDFPHAGLLVSLTPEPWLRGAPAWRERLRQVSPQFRYVTLSTAPVLWRDLGTTQQPGAAAALVGPLDGDVGYAGMEIAANALVEQRKTHADRTIPVEIVTAETLPDFAARYSAAAGGLNLERFLPR